MNSESTSSLQRKCTFATELLITFFAIGCGSGDALNRQAICGFVNVDGNPLKHGLIRFEPQGTTTWPGVMVEILDGQFCFSKDIGPIPGTHRVEVEATQFHGFAVDNEAAYTAAVMRTGRSPPGRNLIPAAYNSNSTLTVFEQDSNDQTFPFDLRSKP